MQIYSGDRFHFSLFLRLVSSGADSWPLLHLIAVVTRGRPVPPRHAVEQSLTGPGPQWPCSRRISHLKPSGEGCPSWMLAAAVCAPSAPGMPQRAAATMIKVATEIALTFFNGSRGSVAGIGRLRRWLFYRRRRGAAVLRNIAGRRADDKRRGAARPKTTAVAAQRPAQRLSSAAVRRCRRHR